MKLSRMMESKITGMSCQYRVGAVTQAQQGVPGVVPIAGVELESRRSPIAGDADPRSLAAEVRNAGYRAEPGSG